MRVPQAFSRARTWSGPEGSVFPRRPARPLGGARRDAWEKQCPLSSSNSSLSTLIWGLENGCGGCRPTNWWAGPLGEGTPFLLSNKPVQRAAAWLPMNCLAGPSLPPPRAKHHSLPPLNRALGSWVLGLERDRLGWIPPPRRGGGLGLKKGPAWVLPLLKSPRTVTTGPGSPHIRHFECTLGNNVSTTQPPPPRIVEQGG